MVSLWGNVFIRTQVQEIQILQFDGWRQADKNTTFISLNAFWHC